MRTDQGTPTAAAALSAFLLLMQGSGLGQTPAPSTLSERDQALRARRIAEDFQANARVMTIVDRAGTIVRRVGEPALFTQFMLSPDGTRIAFVKRDVENETVDLFVMDIATGRSTQLTSNQKREFVNWPVWSPDGRELAYVALRGGNEAVYRRSASADSAEQLVYAHPGAGMALGDWSLDGRFLTFAMSNLKAGVLYVLPLADADRKPIEVFRSDLLLGGPRFSPDGRFISYTLERDGRRDIHIRAFDPAAAPGLLQVARTWQLSDGGVRTPAQWRRDGGELYYRAYDGAVITVDVRTDSTLTLGTRRVLFHPSDTNLFNLAQSSFSRDGQRILGWMPMSPTVQQIVVFDRQGNVVRNVGEPGNHGNAVLSPDGTRIAVVRMDPRKADPDIWTFDVASGRGTPLTSGHWPDLDPVWSADGTHVAYTSTRGSFSGVYRKAWNGSGDEEQLFRYTPGAFMVLTDWAADGKLLTFHDGCAGVLHVVPLDGNRSALEREASDWLRDEYNVAQARLSPDMRFMAYLSGEGKTTEESNSFIFDVYVRPFDATKPGAPATTDSPPIRVSTQGAIGMVSWRQDGRELYYLTPDLEVMAVDVTTTPAFQAGKPRLLFKVPEKFSDPFTFGNPTQLQSVSRDGQRFVFTINVPASDSIR